MKTLPLLLIASSIILHAHCSQGEQKQETATPTDSVVTSPATVIANPDSITLNNGAKWKVVPNMMHFIRQMEKSIRDFSSQAYTDIPAYQGLGMQLQQQIDSLTTGCTMEGKAHDELHKWLLPFIEKVDQLKKESQIKEAQTNYQNLESSFNLFNAYFE